MMGLVNLRPWKLEDAASLTSIANNRNIYNNVRNNFPTPYTIINALQWINLQAGIKPVVSFAIEYMNQLAGTISCTPKDDIHVKNIEIGYFLGENYWNKGIATEAVSQIITYIKNQFSVNKIYAEVYENNNASMSVLRKNGFYLEAIRKKESYKNGISLDVYIWVKFI